MKTHKVRIEPWAAECEVPHGSLLLDALRPLGMESPCAGLGICGNCRVELLEGNIEVDSYHSSVLSRKAWGSGKWRLACRSRVTGDIVIRLPEQKQAILSDEASVSGMAPEEGYGIAVDLGSTTVVVQLVSLRSGNVVASCSELNMQTAYGADVISRISFATRNAESAALLCGGIRSQIGRMIGSLSSYGVLNEVCKVVLVGNSVMHHLFGGLDVSPLAVFPFQSPHNGCLCFQASSLNWDSLQPSCPVCFLPNLGSFVGSDILAGIEALQIHRQERWQALVDLGTNGEIVVGNSDRIMCASTAAGPAFEGVHLSCGMRAVPGAVYRVDVNTGRPDVIGGGMARGVCGSGLVDAMCRFLHTGQIDFSGAIHVSDNDKPVLPLAPDVVLSEHDIREFQLAKAAISAGLSLVVDRLGISVDNLERVYVSGGLGHFLDADNAVRVGLFPVAEAQQICRAGNTALRGCKRFLYRQTEPEIEEICRLTSHYSLETAPGFQDVYCNHLFLGPPNEWQR